jgi:hypothetical protein
MAAGCRVGVGLQLENHILCFDVTMQDPVFVEVGYGGEYAPHHVERDGFGQWPLVGQMQKQLDSFGKVRDQKDGFVSLYKILERDDVRMVD